MCLSNSQSRLIGFQAFTDACLIVATLLSLAARVSKAGLGSPSKLDGWIYEDFNSLHHFIPLARLIDSDKYSHLKLLGPEILRPLISSRK